MSPLRGLAALGVFVTGVFLVATVDSAARSAQLRFNGPAEAPLTRGFDSYDAEIRARIAGPEAVLRLPGLPPRTQVDLGIEVSTAARRPFEAQLWVNGRLLAEARAHGYASLLEGRATTDARGSLHVRFQGRNVAEPPRLRVYAVTLRWRDRVPPPPERLAGYALALALGAALCGWAWRSWRAAGVGVLIVATALAGLLVSARLLLMAHLPFALRLLGAACLAALLLGSLFRMERAAARWVLAGLLVRAALVLQPAFPCMDGVFHRHNLESFRQGRLLIGKAPGPGTEGLTVPYPPALYALLATPQRLLRTDPSDDTLVRWAILLLEASLPLLVLAAARSGGASLPAASFAAAAAAVMPEGLLVSAMGIAANSLGNWCAVLVLGALARGAASPLLVAYLALALLSHFGAGLLLLLALALWLAALAAGGDRARVARVVACVLAAASLAYLVYYREVWALVREGSQEIGTSAAAGSLLGVRAYRLGKTLQDLVLKLGFGPLMLAWFGARSTALPGSLRALGRAWLAAAGLAALLAFVSPLPLRFELFAAPVVAILAGQGASDLLQAGRRRWLTLGLGLSLSIQILLGTALLSGAFDPINVILESPRWPLLRSILGVGTALSR